MFGCSVDCLGLLPKVGPRLLCEAVDGRFAVEDLFCCVTDAVSTMTGCGGTSAL